MTFDSHAVIPAILEKPQLDVEKDLMPVFLVGTAPYVIATNASRPFKTFADVIAASKAKPGSIQYASVGIGTLGHLAMTMLAKQAGVEITHVPYRGGGPAMNDVLGGHVDLIAGSAALVTAQLGPNLRPLLQLGRERLPSLKDTQTSIEAGFPDSETLAWWGIFAPTGTPPDVVDEHGEIGPRDPERAGDRDVSCAIPSRCRCCWPTARISARSSPSRSASGARSCARTTSRRSACSGRIGTIRPLFRYDVSS